MAFKKGDAKPVNSGRKVGSLNKRTVARVSDVLAEKGIDPTEKILRLIQSGALEPKDELKAWTDLLSYTQAKPKEEAPSASEDDDEDDELVDVTDSVLIQIATGKTSKGE